VKRLLLALLICSPVSAAPVAPNFTTGTVTSHTESTTTINETIRQTDFQTGWSYTASGTNIVVPSSPAPGTSYRVHTQGAPFQFTESHFGPGLSRETVIERQTTIFSVTDSVSVFTQ
jgi:hypothetical protein